MLVVGINYAPEHTGIAPYTTGMAEHLAATAESVTVLTGVPHYPSWTTPAGYRWTLRATQPAPVAGLKVRRLRHYVPDHQSIWTRASYEFSFLANTLATWQKARPDLVVGITPSLGGAVAAARLAARRNSRLLLVVQDLMAKAVDQSGISGGGGRPSKATATLERYALRQADRVAVVSDAFRDQLHEYGIPDERISLLPNWTHITPADLTQAEARQALGWAHEPFTVVHTGNIGLKQGLENMVEAARLLAGEPDIRFVIVGDGSQRDSVRSRAEGLTNVTFVDPLDDVQYPKSLIAADVLVVNERPGVEDMSLPSKLTSYLTSGRPIVAAVSPKGATARELNTTMGAALVVEAGSPAALAAGVRALRDAPALRAEMGAAGTAYARAVLGEDAAMRRLDALIKDCLNPRP